jgi:hypothetical protein
VAFRHRFSGIRSVAHRAPGVGVQRTRGMF